MAKHSYLRAIGRELGRHAVWEPGTPVAPGDYGVFRDGAFVGLGSLVDLGLSAPRVSAAQATPWTFASKGVRTSKVGAELRAQIDANARTGVEFTNERSVLVTTRSSLSRQVSNLQEVANEIATFRPGVWGLRKALVREVREVTNACVLVAANAGASAVVSGEIELESHGVESTGFSLEVESSSDSMVSYSRLSGPLLLDIVYIWLLPGGITVIGAGPGGEPYRIEAVESGTLPGDTDAGDP